MRKVAFFKNGFARIVMVTATITLIGFVAFRFLDAQDNTEIAMQPDSTQTSVVATVQSVADVQQVTAQLDAAELDAIDADLDSEFNF